MKTAWMILAAGSLMATNAPAQSKGGWVDEYYKAKQGRTLPKVEARQKADEANTAWREEEAGRAKSRPASPVERYFRSKWGRSSPMEEARQRAEQTGTAWREEQAESTAAYSHDDWMEQYFRAKFGRSSPKAEQQRKSERGRK